MRMRVACVASGVAAVTAGAALLVSGGAPAHLAGQPSVRFLVQARSALVRYLRYGHPGLMPAHPPYRPGPGTVPEVGSYNWAGYADLSTKDGTFTKVAGSWTMPAVTCTPEDTIVSEWVGLDGISDKTVEQDGTVGWCYEDTPTYYTWYEMNSGSTVQVGKSLQPGDKITASVTHSGTSYTLKLTDATNTSNSFTETATCAANICLDLTAEWITERPSFAIGMAPLADYGTWKLTDGTETASGTSGTIGSYSDVNEIEMADATDQYPLSTPSALTSNKTFTTTWDNSY